MQISISNIVKGTVIGSAFTAISRYFTRVTQAGAIYEKPLCVESGINSSPLLQQASMLILPSGYKGGTAYAELPSNGNGDLTWTRGSDAFRTNASGVLQRVPWNLLLNTNTFSGWSLEGGALTSGFTAPDGTSTAYKYVQTTGGLYSGSSTATSGSKTASIWLKSVSGTSITCNLQDGGSGNNTVVTVTGDWQLFTATYTTSTSRPSLYVWGISNASGIYVWHPQLVEGTTDQTYLPTTDRLNFPRLSYMYGSCPALLLEPQRTNLALMSEEFNSATWAKNASATITANSTTAPDGNTTADTLTVSASTFSGLYQAISGSSAIYTISVYVKKGTKNWFYFLNTTGTIQAAWFDLNNGILGTVTSGYTATMTSVGNGWYRCSVSQTTNQLLSYFQFGLSDANNSSLPSSSGTAFIWGAQVEVGAYPTTYIPTTTASATATRVADSFSRNNIYTNGLISASGGTWFVELRNNIGYTRDNVGNHLILSDTSLTNFFRLRNDGTPNTRLRIQKNVSGVGGDLFLTTTNTVKIAIKWNGTTADVFVNGVKEVSATSFTATQLQDLASNPQLPAFIQSMALYPTPLSDTDCTTLTTL